MLLLRIATPLHTHTVQIVLSKNPPSAASADVRYGCFVLPEVVEKVVQLSAHRNLVRMGVQSPQMRASTHETELSRVQHELEPLRVRSGR